MQPDTLFLQVKGKFVDAVLQISADIDTLEIKRKMLQVQLGIEKKSSSIMWSILSAFA